mgnify:CR=1 FL=1
MLKIASRTFSEVGRVSAPHRFVLAAFLAALTSLTPQQQTFRATADMVIVDVSVRQGGQPVPGLATGDFVVLDNGVRQDIERVGPEKLQRRGIERRHMVCGCDDSLLDKL